MKLLVLTQKVDRTDPVLGFFHNWLRAFAPKFEHLLVVCLFRGRVERDENIEVESLGKERGSHTLTYVFNFYRLIIGKRKEYDAVFVHMNIEYVILGALFFKLFRKPVVLWYNHRQGGLLLRIAALFSDQVLYTSPYAAPASFKNGVRMPAGIDPSRFKKEPVEKIPNSILFLGRIAPIKGLGVLLKALHLLKRSTIPFTLDVYGESSDKDAHYAEGVKKEAVSLPEVVFRGSVENEKTPALYGSHEIFINLSPSGLFDKTILEAMACESVVLISSRAFGEIIPSECIFAEGDSEDLKMKIEHLLALPPLRKEALGRRFREYVVSNHSLESLSEKLFRIFAHL